MVNGTDLHVDFVKNEWLAGFQEVVARLCLKGGKIEVTDSPEPDTWREIALKPLVDSKTGRTITPEKEPKVFLSRLAKHVNSSHLFATEPHDRSSCPFPDRRRPMSPARGSTVGASASSRR